MSGENEEEEGQTPWTFHRPAALVRKPRHFSHIDDKQMICGCQNIWQEWTYTLSNAEKKKTRTHQYRKNGTSRDKLQFEQMIFFTFVCHLHHTLSAPTNWRMKENERWKKMSIIQNNTTQNAYCLRFVNDFDLTWRARTREPCSLSIYIVTTSQLWLAAAFLAAIKSTENFWSNEKQTVMQS